MDLNHLFFFMAVVTPLAVLAKAWRPGPGHRSWRIAAYAVLVVAALAWFFFRENAGYIGGGAWLALLFIPGVGIRRVADLTEQHRYRSARRLASVLKILHPSNELRHEIEVLRQLETRPDLASAAEWQRATAKNRQRRLRNAPAVSVIIILNIAAFLFEIAHSNWQSPIMLHRLGALEPAFVIVRHEYWRLFTALFLHFDIVHLLFNLFALYVLGPPLERAVGAWRFSTCYLISGLGASAGVVVLTLLNVSHTTQLVGASGAVMGIVGAWAGFLLRHHHAPLARQRLMNVVMIVAIQFAFDLSTPQISMAAHLCGLVMGFVVGLVIVPARRATV